MNLISIKQKQIYSDNHFLLLSFLTTAMQEKSINLISSTDHNSYIHPLKSNYQKNPYNPIFNQNTLINSSQINQNYVQVPRGNLMASVNQPYLSNSKALPLSSYPIILKGIVQSQHIPPNSLVKHLPIRRHPQYDLNPNFDYEQANFLCQSKITEEDIYCPVCNTKYLASQKEIHIQKHIRKPAPMATTDSSIKIKQYFARQHKSSGYKVKPIVQPEEGYADYKPNTYKIIQKIIYQDQNPNIKQRSIGNQEKQQQYTNKIQNPYFQIEPEPNNFLSNYHNSVKQPNYIIDGHPLPDQPVIYDQPHSESKLLIPSQIIQIQPQEEQIYKRETFYDNNNLQRRTLTPKTNSVNPIQQPHLNPIIEEPLHNQQNNNIQNNPNQVYSNYPEKFQVEPQNYDQIVNPNQNQKYPLRRSLAPQTYSNNPIPVAPKISYEPQIFKVEAQNYNNLSSSQNQKYPLKRSLNPQTANNYIPSSQYERERASLNPNQNNKSFQNQEPNRHAPSQADSFSNAHDIKSSSKNQLSKKDSQAYFSQYIGDNIQGDEIKERKKIPYRSQW